MPDPKPRFAKVDARNPEAFAKCDRCGFWYNRGSLQFQYEWAGTHLFSTGALVCTTGNRCYDRPFEQLRTIILPPDPPPVRNARTEYFDYDEQTVRVLEYNIPTNPPWGAGPQTIRTLQDNITPRLLEFLLSTQGTIGRITDQTQFLGTLSGTEIMEIVLPYNSPTTPLDGRLTSLPALGSALSFNGTEVMELIATGRGNIDKTVQNANVVPLDGRITSLQEFLILLAGTEVMELVMPNNQTTGQNYQITTALLAAFFSAFPFINVAQVPQGSTYTIKTTDTRILIVAGTAAPTSIIAPLASTMLAPYPVLIKDWIGTASPTDPVNITFTGGEECDGQAEIQLENPYAWTSINPNTPLSVGGWWQSS